MNDARFSLIVARRPAVLSKSFTLDDSGALSSSAAAQMLEGEAFARNVPDLAALAALFDRARGHHWAIASGVTGHERIDVVTKSALCRNPGAVARSRDYFRFPDGPGLLALDYDPAGDGAALTAEQLRSELINCCPWLYSVSMLFTPSTSGCIYHGERMLRGPGGWHVYIIIEDAACIPRAVDAIFQQTFEKHGFALVTKSGAIFPRTIIDRSSPQPERLLFEAGAILDVGLTQRRPSPLLIAGQRLGAVPVSFHYDTWRVIDPAWLSLKDDAREASMAAREVWIAERIASGKIGEADLRRMLMNSTLADEFEIPGAGRVADVRAAIGRFIGLQIPDPLEPDYRDGALCAVVMRWGIYSMAHGGYALHFEKDAR